MPRWVVAVLLMAVGAVLIPPSTPALAALDGLTAFAIDGDTDGPDDWDALPAAVIYETEPEDVCGNGMLDPDTLGGKLDDLDLTDPDPQPGNVPGKDDLCQAWRAFELVPDPEGSLHVVMYGAWERFATNGSMALYWPLVGPEPGKGDDFLITFDSQAAADEHVQVLRWDGSSWVPTPTPAASLDSAVSDDTSFGEFAVDLTAAGLWPEPGDCTTYTSPFVMTQTGNAKQAQLEDYVGLAPLPVSACGDLVITKETDPAEPDPPVAFDYHLERASGEPVAGTDATASGTLTVPGDPTVEIDDVNAATDFVLTEPSQPAGWQLDQIVCDVTLRNGDHDTLVVTDGRPFPVIPGATVYCTIGDVGPPSLTVVKEADPADDTEFAFSGDRSTSGPIDPFTLTDGQSQQIPVVAGDEVTVGESVVAPWELSALDCVGDEDATYDVDAGTATLQLDPGDHVVCTFANVEPQPQPAYLLVTKTATGAPGTTFDVSVDGPGADPADFDLTPPADRSELVRLAPDPDGSSYTIAEQVPDGWGVESAACRVGDEQTPGAGSSVQVTLEPGQVAVCRFSNTQDPPAASLTVVKETNPEGGTGFSFDTPGLAPAQFELDDGESQTFDQVPPGTYTVQEQVPTGWQSRGSCSDGSPVRNGFVQVDLAPGDDVVCTVRNREPAHLVFVKETDEGTAQLFDFSMSLDGEAIADYRLGAALPGSERPGSSVTGSVLPPGTYRITEEQQAGWDVTGIDCLGDADISVDRGNRTVTVELTPGSSADCTFANAPDDGGGPPDDGDGAPDDGNGSPDGRPPPDGTLPETGAPARMWPAAILGLLLVMAGAVAVRRSRG